MVSIHGYLFKRCELFWLNLRTFAFNNKTIFEVLFIVLYAAEQILLLIFTFAYPEQLGLIISVFAIIVLTTFALQKLTMESRINVLEGQINDILLEKLSLESKTRFIIEKYNALVNAYHQLAVADVGQN